VSAPPLLDPFEREHLLYEGAPLLRFSPKAFEVPLPEMLRWVGLDLAAGIPRDIASGEERLARSDGGEDVYTARLFQLGPALAITTEIVSADREYRVVELLGVKGDLRVRINLTRPRVTAIAGGAAPAHLTDGPREPGIGQVRVWGGEPGLATGARASIARDLKLMGIEVEPSREPVREPLWSPPMSSRVPLEAFPSDDAAVVTHLVDLARAHPSDGSKARAARRLIALEDRVKRGDGSAVLYRYELHRAGTGVVHMRRREVEAGPERPGLVRTFNVVGIRGAGRLRIRDVGGRALAEVAGARETVDTTIGFLAERLGMRGA
jgi:hypothetical protein